jgi:FkbM family methyltransferase
MTRALARIAGKRSSEMWLQSLFWRLVSPVLLPDGNRLLWSWAVNPFWLKELIKEIYYDSIYERVVKVEQGDIVVDVGANVGVFTLKASKEIGERGRIISFEPQWRNYDWLCRNLRINRCSNVLPINAAISDFNGIADFYVKEVPLENTLLPETTLSIETHTIATMKVKVRTLSSVLDEVGVGQVDFLKVDAEGVELEVLKGAFELLRDKKIRKLSVATYHSKGQTKIISDFLRSLGYRVSVFRNEGLANFQLQHLYAIAM